MAKFCGNCGAKINDNAKVCSECGTPIDDIFQSSSEKKANPAKKKKSKKKFKITVMLVFVAVAAIIIINVVSKFTGYNALLRKVMAAYEEYDIDTLVSLSSDIYYYTEKDYAENYFENCVGTVLDSFESSVGHRYKLSYEINEVYTLSNRNMSMILEDIQYNYPDFDVDLIEKAITANLIITAEQDEKASSIDLNVVMSKESGTWKLLYLE